MNIVTVVFLALTLCGLGVAFKVVTPQAFAKSAQRFTGNLARPYEPLQAQPMQQAMQQAENLPPELQPIMEAVKNLGTQLQNEQTRRLDEIKAGLKVPDSDPKIQALETQLLEQKGMLDEIEAKARRQGIFGDGPAQERKTAGTQFLEDVEAKGSKRLTTPGVFHSLELKALSTLSASAGLLIEDVRLPMYERPTEPHIRDLIPGGVTTGKVLKFPRRKLSSDVNAAAMVPELGTKPESAFAYEMVSFDVKKIAHYIKTSDELLEDVPAMASFIDVQLIEWLKDLEDAQILKGDGTGNNLLGLYTQAQQFNRVVNGDTLLDKLMRAQTQLRLVNRRITGYVLSPADWETIVLLKGTDSHYIWANVQTAQGQQVWGVPVRDSTKLEAGEWLAGDFARGAQLFDRRQASITVATENQDDFINNRITIMAEERLVLVTYDVLSFVKNVPIV